MHIWQTACMSNQLSWWNISSYDTRSTVMASNGRIGSPCVIGTDSVSECCQTVSIMRHGLTVTANCGPAVMAVCSTTLGVCVISLITIPSWLLPLIFCCQHLNSSMVMINRSFLAHAFTCMIITCSSGLEICEMD